MSYWDNRSVKVISGSYEGSRGRVIETDKQNVKVKMVVHSPFTQETVDTWINKNDVQTSD